MLCAKLLPMSPEPNPLQTFEQWYEEAKTLGLVNFNGVALATADAQGRPSVRYVLLKHFDENGFVFFTNYQGRKSRELTANPHSALCFYWDALQKQIRIEGAVEKTSTQESATYFLSRPRASQLGAYASNQSEVIPSREFLEQKFKEVEKKYEGQAIPVPEFWGGWRLKPERIEFWQGRPNRLHDRILYIQTPNGWSASRLSP